MPVSEQRLSLFAIISEFEKDVRSVLRSNVTDPQDLAKVIGAEALEAAIIRLSGSNSDQSDANSDFFDFLDLGDEIKAIIGLRSHLPRSIKEIVEISKSKLGDLCAIRNRVMHRRPLAFSDFPDTLHITQPFAERGSPFFSGVAQAIQSSSKGTLYQDYRYPDVFESDSIVLNNLPQPDYDDTGFIGRKDQIQELKSAINGPYPVVTILGIGGVGKSALALQVAYDYLNDPDCKFDAIIWASAKTARLTGVDVENIVTSIKTSRDLADLAVKQIGSQKSDDPFAELQTILETFKVLIFFDNLETVLDDQIRNFVRQIPVGSKIVFTSRIGLGAFDFTIPLGGLTKGQALNYFKRVSSVWKQNSLLKISEDELDSHIKRLDYSPLGIKWFVQAISKGASAQRLLSDSRQLLSFCLDNIIDKLGSDAKLLLYILAITGREQSPASLHYIAEIGGSQVEDGLRELVGSNLILVISGKFGDDDRYKITPLAMGYISRFKAPSIAVQERIRRSQGQLTALAEKAMGDDRKGFVYDPTYLFVRKEFAATDAVAASHLRGAFMHLKNQNYVAATEAISQAREVAPGYFEMHRVEAYAAEVEGNHLLAKEAYEQAFALRSDYPPLAVFFAGFLLRRLDMHEDALVLLRGAIEIDPTSHSIRFDIIRCLMYGQQLREAWEVFAQIPVIELPSTRAVRIYYDLKVQCCHRAFERALDEDKCLDFEEFAEHLELVMNEVPAYAVDQQVIEGLNQTLADWRKFCAREAGSPAGVNIASRLAKLESLASGGRTVSQQEEGASSNDGKIAGHVTKIEAEKGWGFIRCGEGESYFFHRTAFNDAVRFFSCKVGERVRFAQGENDKGLYAISIDVPD